jgi:metallo-beta-lactamase family protein
MTTCEYGQFIPLCEGVEVEFTDAGHLLGSSFIIMDLTENGVKKSIVFSGDIGNINQPVIRDPVQITGADYVVMESTYGDRNHPESWAYTDHLAQIIDETMARGGNVIIPSFAVGRTQELLYFIREIKEQHMVRSCPDFPVYIDSPLAKKATSIFDGDLRGYMDHDAVWLVRKGTNMFRFPNLCLTESSEESKALNEDPTPKVIISASGMCDAGRIRHHLKHNLWRRECTILFVGYQGEGTLGRQLLEGAKSVKLFGEEITVQARLENFTGLSSHADRDHLLKWISGFQDPKPQHVFVVHGDREVAPFFAQTLENMGIPAHAPQYTEVYDLAANTMLERGYLPERKAKVAGSSKAAPAYERLVSVGGMLTEFIKRSRGRDNKSLAKYADQLRQLLEKWDT